MYWIIRSGRERGKGEYLASVHFSIHRNEFVSSWMPKKQKYAKRFSSKEEALKYAHKATHYSITLSLRAVRVYEPIWIAWNREVPICEMTTEHIENALKWIERCRPERKKKALKKELRRRKEDRPSDTDWYAFEELNT